MATPTYDLLDSVTLSGSAATVTFSGISGDYRDLILVAQGRSSASDSVRFRVNGDTGNNYSYVVMLGTGSSANSFSGVENKLVLQTQFGTAFGSRFTVQFLDYSATDKHKPVLATSNNRADQVSAAANRWASTSAITSIELFFDGSVTFSSGSTFHLYGVAA